MLFPLPRTRWASEFSTSHFLKRTNIPIILPSHEVSSDNIYGRHESTPVTPASSLEELHGNGIAGGSSIYQ